MITLTLPRPPRLPQIGDPALPARRRRGRHARRRSWHGVLAAAALAVLAFADGPAALEILEGRARYA